MGYFAHPTTLDVSLSGNTPDHPAPWVHQSKPQALVSDAITHRYREWDSGAQTIVEMDQAAMDVVDAALGTGRIDTEQDALENEKTVHAQNLVLLEWINELRTSANHGLAPYTYADFETEWRTQREAL